MPAPLFKGRINSASRPTLLNSFVCLISLLTFLMTFAAADAHAQKRRANVKGGRSAIVVDERLSALRQEPDPSAPLLQRLGRGRVVSVNGARRTSDGISFYRVAVTRRTRGWVQADSLVAIWRNGDDQRLLRLVRASEDFDRLARARIFLDAFTHSPSRPAALLLFGQAAQQAADKLSREAARRLDEREMAAGGAPLHTYFLNYTGLDRYNRQGITFTFDLNAKRYRYDGQALRELIRRYPQTPEAVQARKHLQALGAPAAP
ncbi:MAG TPA: hypothetical protein VGB73_15995 [Pyrinomonadaceae bacterium]|jgi:hypothetical protein